MAAAPGWQTALLKALGFDPTPNNLKTLDAWQRAEGGSAGFNPLNTTQPYAGASDYNGVHVKNYPSFAAGIAATAATLRNGRYASILQDFAQNAAPLETAKDIASSPWGTGSGVLRVLGAAGAPVPAGAPTPPPSVLAPAPPGLDPLALDTIAKNDAVIGIPSLPASLLAATPGAAGTGSTATPKAGTRGLSAVKLASKFLGVPYVWGGESPKGFDCSGLLQFVWSQKGVEIPRTTYDQFKAGAPVPPGHLEAGDAVFFTGSDPKNGLPGHVGIYLGNGKFIEAPHTGATVRISNLSGRTDYVGARRYG